MRRAIRLPPLKIEPERNNLDWPKNPRVLLPIAPVTNGTINALPDRKPTSSTAEHDDFILDCVLVYDQELEIDTGEDIEQSSTRKRVVHSLLTESEKNIIRMEFEDQLQNEYNLILDHHEVEETTRKYSFPNLCCPKLIRKKTTYITIRAPFHVLLFSAENIRMKLPIEKMQGRSKNISTQTTTEVDRWESLKQWMKNFFDDRISSAIYQPFYRTAVYSSAKIDRFLPLFDERNRSRSDIIASNKEHFWQIAEKNYFTLSERHWLICELLSRVKSKIKLEERVKPYKSYGIQQLISDGVYQSCYPLHECRSDKRKTDQEYTDRYKLRKHWVPISRCLRFQPLDMVRSYMGEKVAFYFAAMGHYTTALILPAILGLIVFLYGIGSLHTDQPTSDICGTFGKTTDMCPLCDKTCPFWKLSESCSYAQVSYVFDNTGTFIFAIVMSLWARVYVELWKRHQAKLQYKWDSVDFNDFNEPIRPEFEKKHLPKKLNPRTGRPEPYIHQKTKVRKFLISASVVLFMIIIVCLTIFASIIYRIQISYILKNTSASSYSSVIITITTALMNLLCSLFLSLVYYTIAQKLTNWESHKYLSDYEAAFSVKVYIFEFVNFYSSLFYVAYFKGRANGYPSTYGAQRTNDFNEQCDPAGCMVELSIQLIIIMIGKQLINGLVEYGIPYICSRRCGRNPEKENVKQWMIDHRLNKFDWKMLVPEYLEMTIQFGFVTLFVTAFPLAPLFALMNNLVELRFDAWKILTRFRRPVLYKAANIGVWTNILSIISYLAVLTNAAVIAWTSEFIPKLTYQLAEGTGQDLNGFVNWTLSAFPIHDYNQTGTMNPNVPLNLTYCRYRDFRESIGPKYEPTKSFWHIIAARLAFMIIFENVIYLTVYLLQLLIPDVATGIRDAVDRQRYSEQHNRTNRPRWPSDVEEVMEKLKRDGKINQTMDTSTRSRSQKDYHHQKTNTDGTIEDN